jgi:cold shock protein
MIQGTVKFFNEQKGFGFVKPDDQDMADGFLHASVLAREGIISVKEGDRVEYELGLSPKSSREQITRLRLLTR